MNMERGASKLDKHPSMEYIDLQSLAESEPSEYLTDLNSASTMGKTKGGCKGFLPELTDNIYQFVSDNLSVGPFENPVASQAKEVMDTLDYQLIENGHLFLGSRLENKEEEEAGGDDKLPLEDDALHDFNDIHTYICESSSDSDLFHETKFGQIQLPGSEKLLENSMDVLERNFQGEKKEEKKEEVDPPHVEAGSRGSECSNKSLQDLFDTPFLHQLQKHIEDAIEDAGEEEDSGEDESDSDDDDDMTLEGSEAVKALLQSGYYSKFHAENHLGHAQPVTPLPTPPPLVHYSSPQLHTQNLLSVQPLQGSGHPGEACKENLTGPELAVLPFPNHSSFRNENGTLILLTEKDGKPHYHEVTEEVGVRFPEKPELRSSGNLPQYVTPNNYTLQQQGSFNMHSRNTRRGDANRLNLNSSGSEEEYSPQPGRDYLIQINEATREVTVPVSVPSAAEIHAAFLRVRDETINGAGLCLGRMQHNAKERARRARIKISCDQLRQLVPGMTGKTDKATVFEFTVHYVGYLKSLIGKHFDNEFLRHVASCGLDQDV